MTAPMGIALPYGIRDCKITPYTDSLGTILASASTDLPYMQTFNFSEAEDFQELRGDDKLITTRGKGSNVDWTLESGGIPLAVWVAITGGTLVEEGIAPNRRIRLRKKSTDQRPYFRIEGQSINDGSGDTHITVFRCRLTGELSGDLKDGEFFVSNAKGQGLPLLDDTNDLIYEIAQNEQRTAVTLTPTPNPIPTPQNVVVGTIASATVALSWSAVAGATGYIVQQAVSPYSAYTDVGSGAGGTPVTNSTTVTGRTASTAYKFRVKAVTAAGTSDASVETGVVTTTA